MSHFIYAMKSTDPAPAAGGDTKSWFYYYKWDVDGFAYVPVPHAVMADFTQDFVAKRTVLWFVMDEILLGCVPIHAYMPSPSGDWELHYDTRLVQMAPEGTAAPGPVVTGMASDKNLFDVLKRSMDVAHPPRNPELAAELAAATD